MIDPTLAAFRLSLRPTNPDLYAGLGSTDKKKLIAMILKKVQAPGVMINHEWKPQQSGDFGYHAVTGGSLQSLVNKLVELTSEFSEQRQASGLDPVQARSNENEYHSGPCRIESGQLICDFSAPMQRNEGAGFELWQEQETLNGEVHQFEIHVMIERPS